MATEHKTYELTVEERVKTGKVARKLRHQELVAGVVYGHKVDTLSVQVPMRELDRIYLRAGSNTLIDLKVGNGAAHKVFILEVQRNPVTHNLQHVDFVAVNLRQEITSSVPIVIIGESEIIERNEGILLHGMDHVQVRALPMDLPSVFQVDISSLAEVGDAIHVSDLEVPENVTLLTDAEEFLVKVAEPTVEPVEEVEETEGEVEGEETDAEANAEGGDNSEIGEQTA